MLDGSKVYKIYFPISTNLNWLGGLNYYKNLFKAIKMYDDSIQIFLNNENDESLYEYANVVLKKKKNIFYYKQVLQNFCLRKNIDKNSLLQPDMSNYDVISHTSIFPEDKFCISWIPDFQHIYLPDMFSEKEIKSRNKLFTKYAEKSSIVLLSSNNAKNDYIKLFPQYAYKARVLNFVSYIDPKIYSSEEKQNKYNELYNLPEKYFYMPNQFWKHKNHITVFKAINHLKQKGISVKLLCSGNTQDYRNKAYYNDVLVKYINDNQLNDNIKILGIIESDMVKYLMRNSISIVNPSLFEGWSTCVEEAKSLGKNMILSDLDVHKEQNPKDTVYFSRKKHTELAEIFEVEWNKRDCGPNYELENEARNKMNKRIIKFGKDYVDIIQNIK